MFFRGSAVLFAGLGLAALAGCTGNKGLTGQVTYEGVPVERGYITFMPADGKGPSVGGAITQGRYAVQAITPGTKLVKIEAIKSVPFAGSSEEMERQSREIRSRGDGSGLIDPADALPMNAVGNNEAIEVRRGQSIQDFYLEKPGTKK